MDSSQRLTKQIVARLIKLDTFEGPESLWAWNKIILKLTEIWKHV